MNPHRLRFHRLQLASDAHDILEPLHVGSLRTFLPLDNLKFNFIAFFKGLVKIFASDCSKVDEHVCAVFSPNETISLRVIEPLDLATRAVESAIRADAKESGAVWLANAALREAAFGYAYLAAGRGKDAAVEFRKILDHNGLVWNCWTGALAHLGVARANALQAITSQGADADAARVLALSAYNDFLTLWKESDPNIPILKQAKVEYAKLQ